MQHFEVTVCCPFCSHQFRARIHSERQPDPGKLYVVSCPQNRSRFRFIASGSVGMERRAQALFVATNLRQVKECESHFPEAHLVIETEADWVECVDPDSMLEFLRGKVSDRKLRLFACACVRNYLRFMAFPHSDTGNLMQSLELSERYADGLTTRDEWWRGTREQFHFSPWQAEDARVEAVAAVEAAAGVAGWHRTSHFDQQEEVAERRRLATFVHCVFGPLPFRPITLDPTWLSSTVQNLANSIYADQAFDRLPILADAIEDAGCTDAKILAHCREPGSHVRGCFVVDLLLGKE
jgi:hypothetical protein